MDQNNERKPESYLDEFDTLRYKWVDETPQDLHAIQDMMYNQARKINESLDGRSWSKLFVGNDAFKMCKSIMTLFQDKWNVHYSYEGMRDFLKKEFNIDSPLPRHEKIDYPYEDHPDNVMSEIQNRVSRESLNPNTLGNEYDITDPKNADAIAMAIADAEKDLENLDFEALAAEQLIVTEAADISALNELINNDIAFEALCAKKDIDPFQYAKLQFELRGSGPAISFADAMAELESFDKAVLDRYIIRKDNEAKGIYEDTPLSSILTEDVTSGPKAVNDSEIPDLNTLGPESDSPGSTAAGKKPQSMDMDDHIKKMNAALDDQETKPDAVNEYMRQIQAQDKGKSGAQEGYNPKAEDEKKATHGSHRGGGGGMPNYSMSIRMPFEERIASMVTGAVSYPGSLFRNFRDSAVSRKRVVESRNNLFRDLHHVGSNFGDMTGEQKIEAVKRITDTVKDYVRDIQDAGDVAKTTGDRKLKGFLEKEGKTYGDLIKKTIGEYAGQHKELEELKKYMDKMMESIKNIIKTVLSALTGGAKRESSPSPSP